MDSIFTHFIDDRESSYRHGRFSGECENLRNISEKISSRSLFLFDEALSSTGAGEAAVLAREILLAYADIGARGIFTTHLHELCALAGEGKDSKIKNLTAELEEDFHKRTYRIQKGGSGGQSYAMDIARSYRLTKEDILSMHKNIK